MTENIKKGLRDQIIQFNPEWDLKQCLDVLEDAIRVDRIKEITHRCGTISISKDHPDFNELQKLLQQHHQYKAKYFIT